MPKDKPKSKSAINWENPAEENKAMSSDFKKFCLEFYPKKDKKLLLVDIDQFSSATEGMSEHFEKFHDKIADLPLLSVVAYWVENATDDKFLAARNSNIMQELISCGYIGLKDNQNSTWTLKHMAKMGHDSIIEAIRLNDTWQIDKTEEYVRFYVDFVNWLSEKTFSYIPQALDPDLRKTARKRLPYNDFITIVKNLNERERLIAQLIYFGGQRTLEEVLAIEVDDVKNDHVTFKGISITYPKHVMRDLNAYIGRKKKGYIFVGPINSEKIDGTVPYRCLKTVIFKLKMNPTFTFKDFSKYL